jgi:hypothetical protein
LIVACPGSALDIWRICLIGLQPNDREQWHAEITHFSEQSMQRGLVGHWAGEERLAIVLERDGQALEPVDPLSAQMARDPDLIDYRFAWISFWVAFVCHDVLPVVAGHTRLCQLLDVHTA